MTPLPPQDREIHLESQGLPEGPPGLRDRPSAPRERLCGTWRGSAWGREHASPRSLLGASLPGCFAVPWDATHAEVSLLLHSWPLRLACSLSCGLSRGKTSSLSPRTRLLPPEPSLLPPGTSLVAPTEPRPAEAFSHVTYHTVLCSVCARVCTSVCVCVRVRVCGERAPLSRGSALAQHPASYMLSGIGY